MSGDKWDGLRMSLHENPRHGRYISNEVLATLLAERDALEKVLGAACNELRNWRGGYPNEVTDEVLAWAERVLERAS